MKIFCDGSSTPDGSAIAFLAYSNSGLVAQYSEFIPSSTNNQAEYYAIIAALEWLNNNKYMPFDELEIYSDSELVVNQINEKYRVENDNIVQLNKRVNALREQIKTNIKFLSIPREQNEKADKLCKEILRDEQAVKGPN